MNLPARLRERLAPWRAAPAWRLAFSGGLDSTVLLHLLATLARSEQLPPISAIHVHHGLQVAADAWPPHCARVCEALGVPLEVVHVRVQSSASLEQAARQARYAAFAERLVAGEVMFVAQHRDDQTETLLFRLLRGAGVRGLAAMPCARALGSGWLARPLLDFSRQELQAYADANELIWVDDPSNADSGFSRNFLRNEVLPLIARHWPQAAASMARTAEHMREAQELLDELAGQDLQFACQGAPFPWLALPSLDLAVVAGLSEARQRNLLRSWLAPFTRLPDSDHWQGWRDLRDAATDAEPLWRLADGELRRACGRIWWLSGDWLQAPLANGLAWPDGEQTLSLPGNGRLSLPGTLPVGDWHIRYRQGGEQLLVDGRGRRDLKRLLNEQRLPAFVRGRLPLLYDGERLVAVANLDLSGDAEAQLRWIPPQ